MIVISTVAGVLTIVKVGDCLEDVAGGVERLRPIDSTGRVLVRIQDYLGVDKAPGGDSFVQSLAKSSSSCHVCSGETVFATCRT